MENATLIDFVDVSLVIERDYDVSSQVILTCCDASSLVTEKYYDVCIDEEENAFPSSYHVGAKVFYDGETSHGTSYHECF